MTYLEDFQPTTCVCGRTEDLDDFAECEGCRQPLCSSCLEECDSCGEERCAGCMCAPQEWSVTLSVHADRTVRVQAKHFEDAVQAAEKALAKTEACAECTSRLAIHFSDPEECVEAWKVSDHEEEA